MDSCGPTPAQRLADAVWAASEDELTTVERLALLAYASHARNGSETAWLTRRRLMQLLGTRSRETATRVQQSLVKKGWLVPMDTVKMRGGRTPLYLLTPPVPVAERGPTTGPPASGSGPVSGPLTPERGPTTGPLVESGPSSNGERPDDRAALDCKEDRSPDERGPISDERGPMIGPRLSSDSRPPEGGGRGAGARASAPAPAREAAAPKAAPQDPNPATANGHKPSRAEVIADLRRKLPAGQAAVAVRPQAG